MIEELITQLASMPDLNWVWAILFVVGFGLGFGGLILNMFFEKVGQVEHGLHLCYIGFAVIGICALVVVPHGWQVQDLRDEIKSEHISLVSQMTCDDIRLEIISIMERENQKYKQPYDYQRDNLAWEEGYYYAKCELPLRDEILKLQTPQFILEMAR